MMRPKVSVIVPCYNEEKFIGKFLENLRLQDYPSELTEVMIADGMSSDRTCEIIGSFRERMPNLRLLKNDSRYVPGALNLAIRESAGSVILRMDVHSEYPGNYISALVGYLTKLNADNVGGIWKTMPGAGTPGARAIAVALSSGFGVGNAQYRLGTGSVRKVDTVPYGCFPRTLFDRIGFFDPELLRNQDDEFNARIIENGGSIYLVPDIEIRYYARPDLLSLWKMFYQYALFKPLVNSKLKKPATLRQFVPPLFVLFIITGWIPTLIHSALLYPYLAGTGLYLMANVIFSLRGAVKSGDWRLAPFLPLTFATQHVSYGIGYLAGMLKFTVLKKKVNSVVSSR